MRIKSWTRTLKSCFFNNLSERRIMLDLGLPRVGSDVAESIEADDNFDTDKEDCHSTSRNSS